jgi:hypothetical protein
MLSKGAIGISSCKGMHGIGSWVRALREKPAGSGPDMIQDRASVLIVDDDYSFKTVFFSSV